MTPLPLELTSSENVWTLRGSARFRWAVFDVYEISLYRAPAQSGSAALSALVFDYLRNVEAKTLVDSTIREIERISHPVAAASARWRAALENFVPDLARGDRLTAVCDPIRGATFHLAGKPLGAISEAEFAEAFLAIWLDPATASADVRSRLLGSGSA